MSNAEKQAAFKARMHENGFRRVELWVKGDKPAEAIDKLRKEIDGRNPELSAETALAVVRAALDGLYEDFGGWNPVVD